MDWIGLDFIILAPYTKALGMEWIIQSNPDNWIWIGLEFNSGGKGDLD
jgi:hypothetical protein